MQLVFYILAVAIFTSGFYFVKKSDNTWNGVCNIIMSIVFLMLTQSLLCIANDLLKFAVKAWMYAIPEIAAGVYWWYQIIFKKKIQKYEYHILDVIMVIVMAVIAAVWGIYQFGAGLENFNYRTLDAGNHFFFTRQLVKGEPVTFMHFAAVNTAVWISVLKGIVPVFYEYKIYIVFDLFVLFLNGMVMYSCIRKYMTNIFTKTVGAILSVFYICGHPICSVVFGTAYFSTGMMLVLVIVYYMDIVLKREVNKEWAEAFISFSVLGLCYSYFLFIPSVAGGVIIYLYYENKVRKNQITPKFVKRSIIFWSVMILLGIAYLFMFYVRKDAILFANIGIEGKMYGHPYGDFLFFIPFLILLAAKDIRSKKLGVEEFLFSTTFCMLIVLALGTITKSVSSYYFYKIYAPLWGLAFICTMKYIASMKKEQCQYFIAAGVPWLIMSACLLGGAEDKIYASNKGFGYVTEYDNIAKSVFPVYAANRRVVHDLDGLKSLNRLMMKSAKLSADENTLIPFVGNAIITDPETKVREIFDEKYYSLSNQSVGSNGITHNGRDFVDKIVRGEAQYKYIMVVYGDDKTDYTEGKIDNKEIIYKNKAGYLAKIG